MLTLYTNYATPNGMKAVLLLSELGLEYKAVEIDFSKDEQFTESYLQLNPNNKIPTLVDDSDEESLTLFESGAILLYLADKTGRFISKEPRKRAETIVWLFWQNASLGPMLGQTHHFSTFAPERIDYALRRYLDEAQRLYKVLERRLGESHYLGCDEVSIADFATYPYVNEMRHAAQGIDLAKFPNLKDWLTRIAEREAIAKAYIEHPQKALVAKHLA